MRSHDEFLKLSESFIGNVAQRTQTAKAASGQMALTALATEQYTRLDLAKERAAYYKWKVLESLDKYLIEFEANVIRRGGKVVWAIDADAVHAELEVLIQRNKAETILHCPSSLSQETGLVTFLKSRKVALTQAGIGEFIADKTGQEPFQMAAPVMNETIDEMVQALNPSIGVSMEAHPEDIVRDIVADLRQKYTADIAITGAHFLIAENGMAVLSDNEGHQLMAASMPKTLVILAGIDAVIPTMNDLDIFLPLLSSYSHGEKMSAFNTLAGPRQPGEVDGPGEFLVILTDNGRSNLLAQSDQRQSLSCIQCGACSNVCPVFNTLGGQAMVNGPIGAVMHPHMKGLGEMGYISYASTLCGKCTDICPVKIDIGNHLLRNRRDAVVNGNNKSSDKIMWYSWKKMMLNRKNLNRSAGIKTFMLKSFLKSEWGEQREFPKLAEKSFNQLWREKQNG